jgi:hypothetical protein
MSSMANDVFLEWQRAILDDFVAPQRADVRDEPGDDERIAAFLADADRLADHFEVGTDPRTSDAGAVTFR